MQIEFILFVCPIKVLTQIPFHKFHNLQVLSLEPLIMYKLSLEILIVFIISECPSKVLINLSFSKFHNFKILSFELLTINLLSSDMHKDSI
jgi:hypothetical protein